MGNQGGGLPCRCTERWQCANHTCAVLLETEHQVRDVGRTADPHLHPRILLPTTIPSGSAGGKGRGWGRGFIFVQAQTVASPAQRCAVPCSVPLLLAADRPVMGIYFPQLRALVPSLSSSAWCSQVNVRLHNEVITCTGTSTGLEGLGPRPAKPSHRGSLLGPLQVTTHPTRPRSLLLLWSFSPTWSQMLSL